MTFELDTSGAVRIPATDWDTFPAQGNVRWSDLSPFEQGYVEAMFASEVLVHGALIALGRLKGFPDLAPETLAAVKEDCAEAAPAEPRAYNEDALRQMGRRFWTRRQLGDWMGSFPPRTVTLNTAGKVVFVE